MWQKKELILWVLTSLEHSNYWWQSTRLFTFPACHFLGLRWFPTHFSAYALLTSCIGGQCIFSTSTSLVYSSVRIKERNNLPESQTWLSTSLIQNSKNATRGIRPPALLIRIPNQCIISSNWLIIQFHGLHLFIKLDHPQRFLEFILQ